MKHILSCISLSSDFVSPESLSHTCFIIRQMRHLSEEQKPPEGEYNKLQIKNLIFHSVKNALSVLEQEKTALPSLNSVNKSTTKHETSPLSQQPLVKEESK